MHERSKKGERRATFLTVLRRSILSFVSMMPMILGVVGLVGLFQTLITPELLKSFFNGNLLHDTLLGTIAGGVAAGQAMVSYIIGGELLKEGVSLYAVTAFVLSWVTLGVVQLPLEVEVLGMRFTIVRNLLAFLFTLLIAFATVWSVEWLS